MRLTFRPPKRPKVAGEGKYRALKSVSTILHKLRRKSKLQFLDSGEGKRPKIEESSDLIHSS